MRQHEFHETVSGWLLWGCSVTYLPPLGVARGAATARAAPLAARRAQWPPRATLSVRHVLAQSFLAAGTTGCSGRSRGRQSY